MKITSRNLIKLIEIITNTSITGILNNLGEHLALEFDKKIIKIEPFEDDYMVQIYENNKVIDVFLLKKNNKGKFIAV